jgi:proteic killer suppression protein
MIKSFADKEAARLFNREVSRKFPPALRRGPPQAGHLDAAESLQDLRVPPSNHLEKLSGNRQGQHSIRINDRWRICFVWRSGDAHDVEIVDYH